MRIKKLKDVLADSGKLLLNLSFVGLYFMYVFLVALGVFLLLDGGQDSPSGTSGSDNVLESDGEDVSLLKRKLLGAGLSELGCI